MTTSSRYQCIEFLLNNKGCNNHDLKKTFTSTEYCYKLVCDILIRKCSIDSVIDNAIDDAINNDIINDAKLEECYECLRIIRNYYTKTKEFDKALMAINKMEDLLKKDLLVNNEAKLLTIKIKKHITIETINNNNYKIIGFDTLCCDDFIPRTNIEHLLHQMLCKLRSSNEYVYVTSFVCIYDNDGAAVLNNNVYSVFKYAHNNKFYNSVKEYDEICTHINYYNMKNETKYEKKVQFALQCNNLLTRYWNLMVIENINPDKNKARVHNYVNNINHFYEVLNNEYDLCILNYDCELTTATKTYLYSTIVQAACVVCLQNDSRVLFKKSGTKIDEIINFIKKNSSNYENVINQVTNVINSKNDDNYLNYVECLSGLGLDIKHYVEICCICLDYTIVNKIIKCAHKICCKCCHRIPDKKCPMCRIDMFHSQ